ncbi:hypothetical protein BGX21_002661 [Mortierella sp. AD011]|nr:hypothetical protein BGX21_002661 [Mortierella sp. AD011]
MIMAPISLPPCQTLSTSGNTANMEAYLNKKRTSVHYPDDSTVAKRVSLHFGPRCRSLSESWAFAPPSSVLPEFSGKQISTPLSNVMTTTISETSTPTSTSSLSSLSSHNTSSAIDNKAEEQPDQELLKTLASFLRGEGDSTADDSRTIKDKSASTTELSQSAGPTNEESTTCDLVITVRDFAYPKTHPYHRGLYPPEPVYEESDIEEDDYVDEIEDDNQEQYAEDRTQGYARGLYDFDAENSTELSFREGENLWIHCRQFPGWFLGEMDGKTGLVPENYVQLLEVDAEHYDVNYGGSTGNPTVTSQSGGASMHLEVFTVIRGPMLGLISQQALITTEMFPKHSLCSHGLNTTGHHQVNIAQENRTMSVGMLKRNDNWSNTFVNAGNRILINCGVNINTGSQ